MGADLSACCGGHEPYKESQIDFAPQDAGMRSKPPSPTPTGENVSGDANFNDIGKDSVTRLEKGVDANLILQDKTMLTCLVRYNPQKESLLLSCGPKVRSIDIHDIKAILHTPEHLKRVEASAGITDADKCAAIHLAQSGNCIPLFFTSQADKAIFVEVCNDAMNPRSSVS